MNRVRSACLLAILAFAVALPLSAAAQTPSTARGAGNQESRIIVVPGGLEQGRAEDTRESFQELMRRYPPALGRVLKLDPTLMSNPTYLEPYPALVEFIKIHPEVARYSSYFLYYVGESNSYERDDPALQARRDVMRMWENTMGGMLAFCVFLTVTFVLVWLVRSLVGHRRWLRTTKVQSEVHNRLLERFSSNEELLTYVQSPAGAHFLQAMPVTVDSGNEAMAAPFGRILWSVQAGLVLACGGVGLLFIRRHVLEEVSQLLLTMGTLAISLGVGFTLAALASYILSNRLGLLDRPSTPLRGPDSTRA